jgi:hypothetical protein
MGREQIEAEMNKLAEEVANILGYPKSICRTMLYKFEWNKDKLLEK